MHTPNGRVLVLDDDQDFCDVVAVLFETVGAVDLVEVHSFDELVQRRDDAIVCSLALLDVNLGPGVPNGVDALEWLRQQGFRGRIVFLTGHARRHVLSLTTTDAEFEVLEKPVDPGVLVRLVEPPSADGAC